MERKKQLREVFDLMKKRPDINPRITFKEIGRLAEIENCDSLSHEHIVALSKIEDVVLSRHGLGITIAVIADRVKVTNAPLIAFFCIFLFSSCATILGGQKTDHQRHKPDCDEPKRQIRIGMFIADCIFFPPGLIIDFATKKIYKKFPNENKVKKCKGGKDETL